jgi:CHAT domain-containing protein/tetratricopeptide (TPR) repeat protein
MTQAKKALKVLALVLALGCVSGADAPAQERAAQAADEPGNLVSRALGLYGAGDCVAALPLGERAEELLRATKVETPDLGMALVVQALCLKKLARVTEAERAYRAAIEIYERTQGPNGPDLAVALDNLASLYMENGRLAEAEKLRLRALDIFKATLGPAHPSIATGLGNLAVLYQFQGRLREAQEMFLKALDITEKAFGPESRQAGIIADNLAGLYRSQRQFDKAEPFYQRAVQILERTLGPDHPDTALALQNYAILLDEMGEREKAEANIKRALAITERLYGPSHENLAAALNTLALHFIEQNRWAEALAASRRAAAISVDLARQGKRSGPTEDGQKGSSFRRLIQAAFNAGAADPALADEGFLAAQRALETEAAAALSQLAARFASRAPAFAELVRERQDLTQEFAERDKLLIAAVANSPERRDPAAETTLRSRIAEIDARLDAIDQALGAQFPDYAALAKPSPLSIPEVQALLAPDEVLVQLIDLQSVSGIPETGFAWFVTKTDARWVRLPIGTAGLERAVATLRCGLDFSNWTDAASWPDAPEDAKRRRTEQIGRRERCKKLTGVEVSDRQTLPFDRTKAHELYEALFGQAADLLVKSDGTGKALLVVPSGSLTTLPFQVLVTDKPAAGIPAVTAEYSATAWLAKRHAVTVLPAVSSLKALRQSAKASQGTLPYIAFGNPLLLGRNGTDKRAFARQSCPKTTPASQPERVAWSIPDVIANLFRGSTVDVAALRRQSPLPETADELCAVASDLEASASEVHLGSRATETEVKRASSEGTLAKARVVHFATHGLIASDTQSLDKSLAEPALMLTPPEAATADDDGLLTASEVAMLKLDADWVVLSACNTAASGENADAEPLSGLARAFFYAGGRALLVSHWYVDSRAAVEITTGAFAELRRNPSIGRAEAFRRSMLAAMSDRGRPRSWTPAAHPAVWAPFVIVGEGGASDGATSMSGIAATTLSPSATASLASTGSVRRIDAAPEEPKPKKKVVHRRKPASDWDWLDAIWGQ